MIFEVERYELRSMIYRVEANSMAEAIVKLWKFGGEPVEGGSDFIEIVEDLGMPVDYCPNLAAELGIVEGVIPSIRGISEVFCGT